MNRRINIFLIFALTIINYNAKSENTYLKYSPVGDASFLADSSAIGIGDSPSSIGLLNSMQLFIPCKICNEEIVNCRWSYVHHINIHHKKMDRYSKFDFTKLIIKQTRSISIVKKNIEETFFTKTGRLTTNLYYTNFVNANMELYVNIYFHTSFMDSKCRLHDRIFCILKNIREYPKCKCGGEIKKLLIHGPIVDWAYNKYCSQSCANRYTNYKRPKEFYKNTSIKAVKTRLKNGSYFTEKNRNHMIEMSNRPEVKEKRKKTNLLKYGVENAGVLGAYSSKEATIFIRNYISELNIPENRCYFKNGGINGKEYYQMIYDEKRKKKTYASYDLVVMNKDLDKIDFVLEYNGIWHYSEEEILADPGSPFTPYPNCPKTKKEAYEYDLSKLNHISTKTNDIRIYWWKTKTLVQYNGKLSYA